MAGDGEGDAAVLHGLLQRFREVELEFQARREARELELEASRGRAEMATAALLRAELRCSSESRGGSRMAARAA